MNSSKVISKIFEEVLQDDGPDIEKLKKEMSMTLEADSDYEQETLNISSMSLLTPLTESVAVVSPEVRKNINLHGIILCIFRLVTKPLTQNVLSNSYRMSSQFTPENFHCNELYACFLEGSKIYISLFSLGFCFP